MKLGLGCIFSTSKHIRNLAARSGVPRLHPRNSFFFGRDTGKRGVRAAMPLFRHPGEIVPSWTQKIFVGGCNGSSQRRSLAKFRICAGPLIWYILLEISPLFVERSLFFSLRIESGQGRHRIGEAADHGYGILESHFS